MFIPLINPQSSFQKLAARILKRRKRRNPCGGRKNPIRTIKGDFHTTYKQLKRLGHLSLATTKRPAVSRGFSHRTARTSTSTEGSMVYSLKRRPRRKSRRVRHNFAASFGQSLIVRKKRRKHSRVRRHGTIRLGSHRPKLVYTSTGWRRPRKSRLFRRPTRINPRRSHRRYRRNPMPKLPFNLANVAVGSLKIAGGIAVGYMGIPVICKFLSPIIDKTMQYRRYYGLLHVVAGAAVASLIRQRIVKEIALTVAGVGVYDLISQNIPQLGLPRLPETSMHLGYDYAPALGASYMGSSELSDDIAYGGDSDSSDC